MSSKRFVPGDGPRLTRLLREAAKTNAGRDLIDQRNGHGAPSDFPFDEQARTIIQALGAGVEMEDWSCVAEGLDMLISLELAMRGGSGTVQTVQ